MRILNFSPDSRIAHPVLELQDVGQDQVWSDVFYNSHSSPKDSSIVASSALKLCFDKVEIRLWKLSSSGVSFEDGQPIMDSVRALCPPYSYDTTEAEIRPKLEWFPGGKYLLVRRGDDSFLLLGVLYNPASKAYSIQVPSDNAPEVRLIEKANQLLTMRSQAGYIMFNFRLAPNGKSIAIILRKAGERKPLLQLVSI